MNHSEQINELASALAKAQSEMQPAIKDSDNPFFKSKYADLGSVWEACRPVLGKNGLCVMQFTEIVNERLMMVTMVAHSSGQWIKSYLPLNPTKTDPQGYGSAITYMRRYGISALIGVVADDDIKLDDDGEMAVGRGKQEKKVPQKPNDVKPLYNEPPKIRNELQKAPNEQIKVEEVDDISQPIKSNPPLEKISPQQVLTITELYYKTDSECQKNSKKFMIDKLGSFDFNLLNIQQYESYMMAFQNNLEKNKAKQA